MTPRKKTGADPSREGSRAKGAAPVSKVLEEALSLLNLPAIDALVRLNRVWPEVAGPVIAGKALPEKLRGNVLSLRVASPAWAQELSLQKPLLLAKLSSLLGEGVVKDLRFEAGPLPAPQKRPEGRILGAAPLPTLPEPEGLAGLADPEMRRILVSIQRKAAAFALESPPGPADAVTDDRERE